jgi:RND family efflux transporter MFP subunit
MSRLASVIRSRSPGCTVAVLALALVCACAGAPEEDLGESGTVVVSAEDLVVVTVGEIEAGPLLSGSLQPERSATVLAEISGTVLRVSAEPGQSVSRGVVVFQIEDPALREAVLSARAAATSTQQALTSAQRNAERSQALYDAGAVSQRALEDARLAVESARAQQSDAEARLALARSQLGKATVRAPFSGIVSERPASTGDVVQPGSELFTIVDPASMRLEARVPSTELAFVREGFQVEFEVTGYEGRTFLGRISRVIPTVDPVSRQVTVFVTIPNVEGRLVGGLYAEGRLAARARSGLLVPAEAVDLATVPPTVLRLRGGVVELIPVEVGLRDEGLERVEVVAGLAAGDTVLVGAARTVTPGTPVRVEVLGSGAARTAPLDSSATSPRPR